MEKPNFETTGFFKIYFDFKQTMEEEKFKLFFKTLKVL